MGTDGAGDLTDQKGIQHLWKTARPKGPYHVVTIDRRDILTSETWSSEQEASASQALFGQVFFAFFAFLLASFLLLLLLLFNLLLCCFVESVRPCFLASLLPCFLVSLLPSSKHPPLPPISSSSSAPLRVQVTACSHASVHRHPPPATRHRHSLAPGTHQPSVLSQRLGTCKCGQTLNISRLCMYVGQMVTGLGVLANGGSLVRAPLPLSTHHPNTSRASL